MRQLPVLSSKLNYLSEDVALILKANSTIQTSTEPEDSIMDKLNFPLKTAADLDDVENCLNEESVSLQLVCKDLFQH